MKLLLTSAGIKNPSIHDALVDLLGKPIAESNALCIPTAGYGHPQVQSWSGHGGSSADENPTAPCASWVGSPWACWSSPRCPASTQERWVAWVRETDVLLVNGGDALYLCHWMRQSGLADLLAVAARDGLGGAERREHGDDPPHRGGLRRVEAAHRWRRDAGDRRLLDLPAPGSPRPAGATPWPTQNDGRPASQVRRTRSTTRPPSKWSTAPSRSSPRGTGDCSPPKSPYSSRRWRPRLARPTSSRSAIPAPARTPAWSRSRTPACRR